MPMPLHVSHNRNQGGGWFVKISVCFQHGWTRHDMGDNAMNENIATQWAYILQVDL